MHVDLQKLFPIHKVCPKYLAVLLRRGDTNGGLNNPSKGG